MFSKFQCTSPENTFSMRGDYFSDKFEYVQARFRLCDPSRGEECAPRDEILDIVKNRSLQIVYTDTFIDLNDPHDTVKVFVDDKTYL